jgi:hypothetical protein
METNKASIVGYKIPIETSPEGFIGTITQATLNFTDVDKEAIRKAAAVMKVHPTFNYIVISFTGSSWLQEEDKEDTIEVVDWRYDTEVLYIFENSFMYKAQGKWDSRDQCESEYVAIDDLLNVIK